MKKRNALWNKIISSRKLRCGGFSVMLTVLLVLLTALVAALCDGLENRFALQADYSFNGATSQGDITRNAIAQLEKDVRIYAVVPESGADENLLSLLNRYDASSDHLTVSRESLMKNPVLKSHFTDAAGNNQVTDDCLIVNCPETGLSRVLTESDYSYRSFNMETGFFDEVMLSYEKPSRKPSCM